MDFLIEKYESNSDKIEKYIEYVLELSLIVVIYLGHNVDVFTPTHGYKIFSMLMFTSGMWLYYHKGIPTKDAFIDLLWKFLIPFLAMIVIMYLTSEVDISNLYTGMYLLPIIIIYFFWNRRNHNLKGKRVSGYEVRKFYCGKYACIPEILTIILPNIVAILNLSVVFLVISLVIVYLIECSMVFVGRKRKQKQNL